MAKRNLPEAQLTVNALVKPKVALSFDIEATDDSPYSGSMVMLGVVAVFEDGIATTNDSNWVIESKEWSIDEIYPHNEESRCWETFWVHHMEVWKYIQQHKVSPFVAMGELSDWLKQLSEKYDWYWVALPSAYDWMWLQCYYDRYGGPDKHPIGFKAECMKGYRHVASLLGRQAEMVTFVTPKPGPMKHYASQDAKDQAFIFLRSREWCRTHLHYIQ